MFNEDRRTIEEAYTSAAHSSDLSCETREGAPRSDSDVLIAAGWSKARLGGALLRLHTEWGSTERARVCSAGDFMQAAAQRLNDSRSPRQTLSDQKLQAKALADRANEQQGKLLMGRLKSFTSVRDQMTMQAAAWGVEDPGLAVASVIGWWLQPSCPACQGRKFALIPNTDRSSAKGCKPCGATGRARPPHGEAGKKLANFMDDCVQRSRQSMAKILRPVENQD